MAGKFADFLHDWHDFYALAGAASATLVGLMFVAASIGSSIFSEEHRAPLKAFFSPTVVNFAAVLFTSLVVTIPTHSWRSLGGLLAAEGVAGTVYSGNIVLQIIIRRSFNVDWADRFLYALVPLLGYLLLSMAAALVLMGSAASAVLIAAGLLTLLFGGVRNAWDMMVWIMLRTPTSKDPS
jgi:hypothetical protein